MEKAFYGKRIFLEELPDAGDRFYIHVTSNASDDGRYIGNYCDYSSYGGGSYHTGVDLGDVGVGSDPDFQVERHIYPVRDGELVNVIDNMDGDYSIVLQVAPGIYDYYVHVKNDLYEAHSPEDDPIPVQAAGAYATRLTSYVTHISHPHLHYAVYDEAEFGPSTRSVRNPLEPANGLLPFVEPAPVPPEVIPFRESTPFPTRKEERSDPDTGILVFPDDFTDPGAAPFSSSSVDGKVDLAARMLDENGVEGKECGVNRLEYDLHMGMDLEEGYQETRVFLDAETFLGEPGQPDYSPKYFNEYGGGCSSIDFSTMFAPDAEGYRMWNFLYRLTNNEDRTGGKAGLSTEGCWDTEATVPVPLPTRVARLYPDGPYRVLVRGYDVQGTPSDDGDPVNARTITVLNDYDHIIYVDDDAGPDGDGSLESPFTTITEALPDGNASGFLIYVAPGTYDTALGESFPLNIPEGLAIQGAGYEYTTIEGPGIDQEVIRCEWINGCLIQDMTITGAGQEPGDPAVFIYNSIAVIRNCLIQGGGAGTGVTAYYSLNGSEIGNCIITGHWDQGIIADHSNHLLVLNSILDDNGWAGIYAQDSAFLDVYNSIIQDHHHWGTRAILNSQLLIQNSDFWLNTTDLSRDGLSYILCTDCLGEDPQFNPADGRDYYLDPGSPCVDSGVDIGVIDTRLYLKTTRSDGQHPGYPTPCATPCLYDVSPVDMGFHYDRIVPSPSPEPTTTPFPSFTPTATPTITPTNPPGLAAVLLDSDDYFTELDEAGILLVDSDLNTDPGTAESYQVTVLSDPTGGSIPMLVQEISLDSSYFTTEAAGQYLTFTTGVSVPYVSIQVADGDSVTVEYVDASPPGTRSDSAVWYSAEPPTETPYPTGTPTESPTPTPSPTASPTAHSGQYLEDFESGAPGWVADGLWHLTATDSHSPSQCMWYGQEVSGDYETGGPNSGALTGPPILLTEDLWLMYHSREETDGTQLWDIRKVQLSTDSGGNWSDLHQSYDDTDQWYGADAIDLSAYAGQVVRVRFWFDTVDAGDNQHKGWLVDDVEIGDLPPPIPALGGIGILTLLGFFLLALLRRSGR